MLLDRPESMVPSRLVRRKVAALIPIRLFARSAAALPGLPSMASTCARTRPPVRPRLRFGVI